MKRQRIVNEQLLDGQCWEGWSSQAVGYVFPWTEAKWWHVAVVAPGDNQMKGTTRAVCGSEIASLLTQWGLPPSEARWEPFNDIQLTNRNPLFSTVSPCDLDEARKNAPSPPDWFLDRMLRVQRQPIQSFVYFIIAVGTPFVKIGWAADPEKRRMELQPGSLYPLKIIKTVSGGLAEEKALHRRFKHLRYRGEWFRLNDDLAELVSQEGT